MAICALGYLGFRGNDLEDWKTFAGRLLAMQQVDKGGRDLAFRMDDRRQRIVISEEDGPALKYMGWEVEQREDLPRLAAALSNNGFAVNHASKALCDQRFVDELIFFHDLDGNRVELFFGPHVTSDPFVSGRPIQGFVTGPYGMGHAVIHVNDLGKSIALYRDILGFGVSDYSTLPYRLCFFHVNGRHHSFAMVETGHAGFHHFMVEFRNLDDVGQGYDLANLEDDRVAYTLGRHLNDYMTSFYAHSPSGFFVENGWGGRIIDPETWVPHETTDGPSLWGHDRLYMPEEPRARLQDMRLDAARRGVRLPPVAECPWLFAELSKSRPK